MLIAMTDHEESMLFATIGGVILIFFVIIAYFINIFKLSKNSINNIAKELNAEELSKNNVIANEEILLNIVEEMAIASQMKMPRIFVIRDETSINAMCSGEYLGTYKERFAIFVTQGALDSFNRDELQGVIGHEFSHIFHDDVELNMKLISIIFAMNCISMIGHSMLKGAFKNTSRSSKNKSEGKVAILVLSLMIILIGFIGSIFSQIIQSAISRQKEFLADASSVQYTRNPDGIKNALRKIGQYTTQEQKNQSHISNKNATPYAHMFFLSSFSTLFATHPSIKERLKRLQNIKL